MVLRLFARVSIRFRRLFWALLLLAAVLSTLGFAAHRYWQASAQMSSIVWNQADFYMEGMASELHPATVYLFSQLLRLPEERAVYLAKLVQQASGSRWGAWKAGETVTVFVQDPTVELALEGNDVKQALIEGDAHTYLLLGDNVDVLPSSDGISRLKHAWTKYRFAQLTARQTVTIAIHEPNAWILGGIQQAGSVLRLRLSAKPSLLNQELESTELPDGSLYLKYEGNGAQLPVMALAPAPFAKLPGEWFKYPSTLHISQGNVQRMIQNPYDSGLSWRLESQLPTQQAQTLLDKHLDELSQAYPLLLDRALPDGTSIAELQLNRDQFLLPGQSLLLADQPSGALTYPRSQLTYSYKNGVFSIEQGEDTETTIAPGNFSCLIPDASLVGYADGSSAESLSWRRIEFSVDASQLSLCIFLE